MNVVVIPARGGSKGIPRKNMIEICGRPLIYYSIQVAMDSMLVDKVVVTSDDAGILDYAKGKVYHTIARPDILAADNAPTEPCIRHVIQELELDKGDTVILLQPTSLLRTVDMLNRCIDKYLCEMVIAKYASEYQPSVFTVHEEKYYHWISDSGYKDWYIDGYDFMAPRLPKQQAGSEVRENGSIYITSAKNWLYYNRFGLSPYPFLIPPICGMELDYPWQIPIFENIIENGYHEKELEKWSYS